MAEVPLLNDLVYWRPVETIQVKLSMGNKRKAQRVFERGFTALRVDKVISSAGDTPQEAHKLNPAW